ncbi:hypothetical protein NKH60_19305 [Mesorhizobium sp. M1006]|uniref:hypothetical protein n=1 Tax=Mesorhizobium sp. M1006 TaxID=2957048 RepID=UPI00333689BF
MSWCDKLASVPSVGFIYDPHFVSGDGIIDAIAPMLDKWKVGDKPDFTLSQPEPLKIEVQHNNGFTYSFEPTRTSIAYQHRVKFRNVSGSRPVAELISSPQPYSQLLDDAISDIVEIALILPMAKRRSVKTIGIVTSTHADEKDIPPGIRKMIRYLSRPWKSDLDAYLFTIVAEVESAKIHSDRCIHTLTRPDDKEQIPNFKFDWQRSYSNQVAVEKDTLLRELQRAKKAALDYFETLAVGDAFDDIVKDA